MTTIPTLSAANNLTQSSPAQNPANPATLSSDFDAFLQMLTAQARYQDPLDPVSSSDYAAQLAQFSMVEQQVFTNDQLGALATALGASAMTTMANWVGMEARAVSSARFEGEPITISPNPAVMADRVQLVIYGDTGREVARRDLPVSSASFDWDGLDQSGRPLGSGSYSFAVESIRDDQVILAEPAEVYSLVVEAQIIGGDTVLKLESGAYVRADQVTALRDPA